MGDAVLEALERDEAYTVVRVLAKKASGATELVSLTGYPGFYVRKRIPIELANPDAWAQLAQIFDYRLPHVIETYTLPDAFVTVCDYVEGFSVAQLVESRGKLDAAQVLAIIDDVCAAADALHARGIIHRDITPGNVIVAADGSHLIDLDIARVGDATARHDTTKLGTWGFAAPEQFGFAQTDARSDVYSIGSLAGYMLTGVLPGDERFDAAVSALPEGLRSVIERARAFEPSARFASAGEFERAFADGLSAPRRPIISRLRRAHARGIKFLDALHVASPSRKVFAIVIPIFIFLISGSSVDAVIRRWPSITNFERIAAVIVGAPYMGFFAGAAYHCGCAIVGARGYAAEQHRVRRYLINVGLMLLAMVASMTIISLVLAPFLSSR